MTRFAFAAIGLFLAYVAMSSAGVNETATRVLLGAAGLLLLVWDGLRTA